MPTNKKAKFFAIMALFWFLFFAASGFAQNASQKDRTVKNGDIVEINYVGKLKDGTVFDKTEGRGPFKFHVGSSQIIPGMSQGVLGMKTGDKKTVTIPPKEAYGIYDINLIITIPMSQLPAGTKVGAKIRNPRGQALLVKEIKGDVAVLDPNHELASKTLIFEIELLKIF